MGKSFKTGFTSISISIPLYAFFTTKNAGYLIVFLVINRILAVRVVTTI